MKAQLKNFGYAALIGTLAAFFATKLLFIVALPLIVGRKILGRQILYLSILIGASILWVTAPVYFLMVFLVGASLAVVLTEGESAQLGYATTVLVAVIVLSGLVFLMGSMAVQFWKFSPVAYFQEQIALALSQVKLPPEMALDKEALLKQVPSLIMMVIIFSVWLNSILAPRMVKLITGHQKAQGQNFLSSELLRWKLPDSFVWLALGATAGHFLEVSPEWLKWTCTNVFNIVVMLYFFQGLAVVVSHFESRKIGGFWRGLIYILIFTQLFLGVAILGFLDLWFGFRDRKNQDKSAVA